MKPVFDLQWGDPVVVRQALAETLGLGINYIAHKYLEMKYPEHFGSPKLIEQLKYLAARQSGKWPKHLFVTAGATGAINASLHVLKNKYTQYVVTDRRRFPMYSSMIKNAGLGIVSRDEKTVGVPDSYFISLTASPSNPEGLIQPFENADIWDSAYASYTYGEGGIPNGYQIMCGSLSKTLGLAGLRLGWASTDNDELADSLGVWVTANSAGQSTVSMQIAEDVLDSLDLDSFETRSQAYLDDNREQIQKLLTKFGAGDVPSRGMFAILELGKTERRALERAGIKWLPGTFWGEDDNWARLSLGQTREVVRAAVKAALK